MKDFHSHSPETTPVPKGSGQVAAEPLGLDPSGGPEDPFRAVLEAWHAATAKLQRTHELLQAEVRRLSQELAEKNRLLRRKTRLEDLGRVASHVAHEVRNCLVPMTVYVSLLRRYVSAHGPAGEILEKMAQALRDLDGMVQDLLHFAADRQPRRQWLPVFPLIDQICQQLRPQLEAQGIRVIVEMPSGLELWADGEMVRRAVLNLVLNAMDAMPQGGELCIKAARRQGGVELEVSDTGPGLPPGEEQRVLEPFFTTKPNGTGLGLAIVAHTVEQHGGQIQVANRSQGGALFRLWFPEPKKTVPQKSSQSEHQLQSPAQQP